MVLLEDGEERNEFPALRNKDFLPGVLGVEIVELTVLLSSIGEVAVGEEELIFTEEGRRGGVVPSQGRKYARYSSANVVYNESPVWILLSTV